VQVACAIGTAFATAMIVRAAPAVARDGTAASTWSSAVKGAWLLGGLFGIRVLAIHGGGLAARVLARRLDQTLRERVIAAALLPAGVAHFEDPELKGAFSSARNLSPLGLSPGSAASNIGWCFGRRLEMVCYVVVFASYSWPIALGMAVVFVLGNAEMYRLLMTQILNSRFVLPPAGPAYYRDLSVQPAAAKEVRVFALGDWLRERYSAGQHAYLQTAWSKRRFVALSTVIALGASGAMTLISLTYFGLAAIRGSIDAGDYTLLVMATFSLIPPGIPQDVALVYGTHVLPQIAKAEAIANGQRQAEHEGTATAPESVSSIDFRGVSFRYPNATADVLRDVDLHLRAGEVTALVGVNGVGKTTLIKLLCGFHRPSGGHILIDGVDAATFDRRDWYRRLAVLFQDFVHYEMSVRDNVELGHGAGEAQLESVAAASGALGFVERLPDRWSTPLASHLEGGADLSGGEWQRLALARALSAVERGARVLVLDEPAASLDVRAESELNERLVQFAHATPQRSSLVVLLVSHRLSTVRRADRIVVLDNGGVVEDGTHDQLIGLGGHYAALFDAQAARYRADASEQVA
jgi:ATP-binding cassette subfamily B protein